MVDDKKRLRTEFTSEVYLAAAGQHLCSLEVLYNEAEYCLAIYVAGLTVESIFRAYRCRVNPEFDARHSLYELARSANFISIVPEAGVDRYLADLGNVAMRWANNHRYRSEVAMRSFLKRSKLDRGVKGDFLKENARRAVAAAIGVVTLGIRSWKH